MSGSKYSRDCSIVHKIASEIEHKRDLKVLADNLKRDSRKPKENVKCIQSRNVASRSPYQKRLVFFPTLHVPEDTKHKINPFSYLDDQIKL